jgi:hypothetical protein
MMTSVRRLQVAFCRRTPMAARVGPHCLRMRAPDPKSTIGPDLPQRPLPRYNGHLRFPSGRHVFGQSCRHPEFGFYGSNDVISDDGGVEPPDGSILHQ